jgi:hypothetical protein
MIGAENAATSGNPLEHVIAHADSNNPEQHP